MNKFRHECGSREAGTNESLFSDHLSHLTIHPSINQSNTTHPILVLQPISSHGSHLFHSSQCLEIYLYEDSDSAPTTIVPTRPSNHCRKKFSINWISVGDQICRKVDLQDYSVGDLSPNPCLHPPHPMRSPPSVDPIHLVPHILRYPFASIHV